MNKLSYNQAVEWLDSLQELRIKPGLERIKFLLEHLDHPEKNFQIIHVGGTNGKGSVCRYLSSILVKEGYTVGLFTSPHLMIIKERFIINETMISEDEFAYLISRLKDIVDHQGLEMDRPTYFELCTALMFLYCDRQKVDYAIIEVGLGGRYDATNIIEPILSIITNVSFDHMDILGETIQQIALEKAGIIKDCVPLITAAEGKALTVIEKVVKDHHSTLVFVSDSKSIIIEQTLDYQLIRIEGMLDEYTLKTHEIGSYQRKNLALAMYAVEQLQMMGLFISPGSITQGVDLMYHQGRMKVIHNNPTVIIDGAHNPSGIHELKTTVRSLFPKKNIILIFGVLNNKDIKEMIKEIHSICQMMIITIPSNDRAADPKMVKNIAASFISEEQILVTRKISDAINHGLDMVKKDDVLLITGSLFLIGEIITYFDRNK